MTDKAVAIDALDRLIKCFKLHAKIGPDFRWEQSSFGEMERAIRIVLETADDEPKLSTRDEIAIRLTPEFLMQYRRPPVIHYGGKTIEPMTATKWAVMKAYEAADEMLAVKR